MSDLSSSATLTTLVNFDGTNGRNPLDQLFDDGGNLFGTTLGGGASGEGTVFELKNSGDGSYTFDTLINFNGRDGEYPWAGLIADTAGNLLGTTELGESTSAPGGDGTVFEIQQTANGYANAPTTLVNFNGVDGYGPLADLSADPAGDLFGTTETGGSGGPNPYGDGTVFEIAKTANGYANTPTTLVNFDGENGLYPNSALTSDSYGDFFGVTENGGSSNDGIAYELINTGGGYTFTTLVGFNGSEGLYPSSNLVIDSSGDLFGATGSGGTSGDGTVFEIPKTDGGYANAPITLVSFNGLDGVAPSGLIMDAAGNLFGITVEPSEGNDGTVFEILKEGVGYANTPLTIATFNGVNGGGPSGGLVADAAGNLFGVTANGGTGTAYVGGSGTVFEITDSGYQVACFLRGTRIATPTGERTVESLTAGELVLTASGAAQPILWIGHRHFNCGHGQRPADLWPVRVSAGAFDDGLPRRDLFLSPDHAVFAAGALIPIRHLINDATVTQEARDEVDYWHVELAQHDVLLAEGLPAESYLDTGNRHCFSNGTVEALHPTFGTTADDVWANKAAAPLVEGGPTLLAVRARLADRAALLGRAVSGVLEIALDAAGCICAVVQADIHTLRLVSTVTRPGGDRRLLGSLVASLRMDGAPLPLDDICLVRGFHDIEQHGAELVRWTNGAGVVRIDPKPHAKRVEIDVAAVSAGMSERRAA